MSYRIVIPARYSSSRLPAKPLKDIVGKPMIQHVWERASCTDAISVTVATDDQRIVDACLAFGADVVLTRDDHESGTDRLAEVVAQKGWADDEVIVNVQGDEPLIPAEVIDQVAHNCASHHDVSVATLCEPISTYEQFINPNIVKVVTDNQGKALYFSRSAIPFPRDTTDELPSCGAFRHLGIYAYRAGVLAEFVHWPLSSYEAVEKLEQLRFMENGRIVHCEESVLCVPGGVDTQDDLIAVIEHFKQLQKGE